MPQTGYVEASKDSGGKTQRIGNASSRQEASLVLTSAPARFSHSMPGTDELAGSAVQTVPMSALLME
jgi:hypothetical protein